MSKTSCRKHRFMFASVMVVFAVLLLASTGCKKDDDDIIVQPDVGGTHYYAVDMFSDLINVQVNQASGLYSYLQLAGPVPIGVGQDTITPATGLGSGAYYDGDSNMWAINPDKFLAMGGFGNIVLGVPVYSSTYPATTIAGMYNWLSMDYDPSDDSALADYGTLQINADGTWEIWTNIDGTTYPASTDDTGTWVDQSNGLLSIMSDGLGGAKIGNVAICPSANGNILIMHYAVSTPFGMVYGMIVGTQDGLAVTIVVNLSGDDDLIMNVKR